MSKFRLLKGYAFHPYHIFVSSIYTYVWLVKKGLFLLFAHGPVLDLNFPHDVRY